MSNTEVVERYLALMKEDSLILLKEMKLIARNDANLGYGELLPLLTNRLSQMKHYPEFILKDMLEEIDNPELFEAKELCKEIIAAQKLLIEEFTPKQPTRSKFFSKDSK